MRSLQRLIGLRRYAFSILWPPLDANQILPEVVGVDCLVIVL